MVSWTSMALSLFLSVNVSRSTSEICPKGKLSCCLMPKALVTNPTRVSKTYLRMKWQMVSGEARKKKERARGGRDDAQGAVLA